MKTTKKCIDEAGHRYGRLTVLERYMGSREKGSFWKCRCDCGMEFAVSGRNLRTGHTRSCGCLKSEIQKKRWAEYRAAKEAAK